MPRARQLALAAAHLGLADLRDAFAARVTDGWVPLWAHGLAPYQSLAGHAGPVHAVALGRLGGRDFIVSAGDDGTVQLWDASGAPRQSLTGHAGPVRAVALGRAGDQDVIVSGGDDETVRLWDATGRPAMEPLAGHAGPVNAVALGRAGERDVIVAGGDCGIRVWDGTTGQILEPPSRNWLSDLLPVKHDEDRDITDVSRVRAVAIGKAGDRDVIVSIGDRQEVWDATRQTRIGGLDPAYTSPVTAIVVGKVWGQDEIVSASYDGEVGLWNPVHPASGPSRAGWVDGPLHAVAIGRIAGRQLIVAGGADGVVWAWDKAVIGQTRRPLARQATTVNAIAISRAANREVVVTGGRDGTVRMWDAMAHEHAGDQPGHLSRVETVAAGAIGDRDVIVSGGDDGFGVWDAATGRAVGKQPSEQLGRGLGVRAVAIGWSGHWNQNVLIVASHKGQVQVYNEIGGLRLRLDALPGSRTQAATGAVRPSEAIVTSGHDGAWAWSAGTPHSMLPGAVYVTPVATGQIGGLDVIVSGHEDGTLRIWNLALGPVASLATHGARITAVAIGKIGGRDVIVAGCADGSVGVWDPTAKPPFVNRLTGHQRPVTAVAAGQTGGRDVIVSGSTDRKTCIWDIATSRLETLEMLDSVTGLAVSARYLAVASGIAVAVFLVPHSTNSYIQ